MKTCSTLLLAIGLVGVHADCETEGDCHREPDGNTWLQSRREERIVEVEDPEEREGEDWGDEIVKFVQKELAAGEEPYSVGKYIHDHYGLDTEVAKEVVGYAIDDHDAHIGLMESETDMEVAEGWGYLLTPRRRSPSEPWSLCDYMLPGSIAKVAQFNLGKCVGHNICELRGKAIGALWEMEGSLKFKCGDCKCAPSGGRLDVARSFNIYKGKLDFGIDSLEVNVGCSIGIGVTIDDDGGNGVIKLTITLSGTVNFIIVDVGGGATLSGSVSVGGINTQANGGGTPYFSAKAEAVFYAEVLGKKFSLTVSLGNTGEWKLPNPLNCDDCHPVVKVLHKVAVTVVKATASGLKDSVCKEQCTRVLGHRVCKPDFGCL